MQAVILAAGISRRLRPLTDSTPKCLLNIGNRNLLQRTMENVIVNSITVLFLLQVTGKHDKDFVKIIFRNQQNIYY